MRTSKTKPVVVNLPTCPVIFCIPQPRMTLEQYAQQTGQSVRAVQHQANEGKFILARGKYGKQREINMIAEMLKEYEDAQHALSMKA